MQRLETIQMLLGIKDTVYGLLEWAEHLSDEEFDQYCSAASPLPEEILMRLENFCSFSSEFATNCNEVIAKLNEICEASGNPECKAENS